MSSDTFSVPRSRYDAGRDGSLSGQQNIVGASWRMPEYICWALGAAFQPAGGSPAGLLFKVPPLPAGSVIRAQGIGSFTSDGANTGQVGVGTFPSPAGNVSVSLAITPSNGAVTINGTFSIFVTIRNRNTSLGTANMIGSTAGTTISSAVTTVTTVDWGTSNTLGLYLAATNSPTIQSALVEVFIPRVYRA